MKLVDDFLAKVGVDKVLHLFGGGLICAIFTFIALLQDGIYTSQAICGSALIGTIVALLFMVLKEILDKKFDWLDIVAGLIGCAFIWLAIGVGFLFNIE